MHNLSDLAWLSTDKDATFADEVVETEIHKSGRLMFVKTYESLFVRDRNSQPNNKAIFSIILSKVTI